MKSTLLIVVLLIFISLSAFSQKEIFFNATKPEDIKVESMQGLETSSSINTISLFQPYYSNDKSFNIPLNIGYFSEKRIAPCWTLTTRIGLYHSFMNVAHFIPVKDSMSFNDSIYHFNSQKVDNYKFVYQLGLSVGIEPRWYFGYKKRYQFGKAKLNSGWYLSLPATVGVRLINTYQPDVTDEFYYGYKDYCSLGLKGILGYRKAISTHLFLEGNFQLLSISSGIYSLNNKFYISQPYSYIFPGISLKAAYTFK